MCSNFIVVPNFIPHPTHRYIMQAEAETKDDSPAGKRKSPEKAEEAAVEEAAAKKQKTPPAKEDEAAVVEEAKKVSDGFQATSIHAHIPVTSHF